MPIVLTAYDPAAGTVNLGDLWTLAKDNARIRCAVSTHPQGWELRLNTPSGGLWRTQVCKLEAEVSRVAEAWKVEANVKGWR